MGVKLPRILQWVSRVEIRGFRARKATAISIFAFSLSYDSDDDRFEKISELRVQNTEHQVFYANSLNPKCSNIQFIAGKYNLPTIKTSDCDMIGQVDGVLFALAHDGFNVRVIVLDWSAVCSQAFAMHYCTMPVSDFVRGDLLAGLDGSFKVAFELPVTSEVRTSLLG